MLLVLLLPTFLHSRAAASSAISHLDHALAPAHVAAGTKIALYDGDISVPDGTAFEPGARFTKVWRIKNAGTVPWTSDYRWHFEAGTLMSGKVISVPVSKTAPGGSTVISVPMQAPMATGVYTSFWQMVDPNGTPFPHQAWVKIVVQHGAGSLTATPTIADAPTNTPVPRIATAQPTTIVPGGDGRIVSSAWVGATVYQAVFPAGSTVTGNDETLAVYYPGPKVAHARVTLYRPDGAARSFLFALSSGQREVLNLNSLAPGTGIAASIEADRPMVTARVYTPPQGLLLEPGATQASRSWLFPSLPTGAPSNQLLMLFNPGPGSASVNIRVGNAAGGCCASNSKITVPPLTQYAAALGAPGTLRGPVTLAASQPIVAERLGESSDHTAVAGVPGSTAPAKHWYLPSVWGKQAQGTVNVFNPSASAAVITIRADLDAGMGRWIERTVAPYTEWRLPLSELASNKRLAADVSANVPVIASASWTTGNEPTTTTLGSAATADTWSFVAGLGDQGMAEEVDLFNPSKTASTVRISVQGAHGNGPSWRVSLPAHGRASRTLPKGTGRGGAGVTIRAARPIVVGWALSSGNAGAAAIAGSLGS
ncbi:MAG: DUF5719 family protein [Chloroflexota bacterium]